MQRLVLLLLSSTLPLLSGCSADTIWSDLDQGFFWKISDPSGDTFLLGTTHAGVEAERLPDAVWEGLEQSPVLILETDIREPLPEEFLFEHGLLPRGTPILPQRLPDGIYEQLVVMLDGVIEEIRLRRFEPWLAKFFAQLVLVRDLPGMERGLMLQAETSSKSFEFLETIEEQIVILASEPRDHAIEDLVWVVDDPGRAQGELEAINDAYVRGDEDGIIDRILAAETEGDRATLEGLIYERNRRWAEALQERSTEGGSFVAVGSAHTIGPDSVVELLRARGVDIQPVSLGQ